MMARLLCFIAIVLALLTAGCGGDDGSADGQFSAPADLAYAQRANAICAEALAETRRLGRKVTSSPMDTADPLRLTTEELIKPGIAIRERLASRLRALAEPQRGRASVDAYLELFEPLEVLTRERLRVGLEGDLEEAQRFEELMRQLAEEQQAAAEQAGLTACAVDFVGAAFSFDSPN